MNKAKKGDCGTCHWFEWDGQEPAKDTPRGGSCLVNPPIPMPQAANLAIARAGQQTAIVILPIWPPTNEVRRCEKWRPAGRLPDIAFDKVN